MSKITKYIDGNEIYKNAFVPDLIDRSRNIILKKEAENEYTKYINDLILLVIEICSKFDDYNYVFLHISNYPRKWILNGKISYCDHIRYHLEIYTLNSIAIFDRFLHLINYLYNIGLKGGKLNLKNIIKSGKVDYNVLFPLEEFEKGVSAIRYIGNSIKHEKNLDIPELEKINTYEFILKHSIDLKSQEKENMILFIKLGIKSFLRKERLNCLKNSNMMAKYINDIFVQLNPIYQITLNDINLNLGKNI